MNAGDGSGDGICLPNDVLADILRRLSRRAVARCRCVCRAWRAIVEAYNLIRPLPYYFPRDVFPGIFFNKVGCQSNTDFFAPPGSRRLFYPHEGMVLQSCNGLFLIDDWDGYWVLNPATARSAHLPCQTPWRYAEAVLAFDPAVSLHYEVFLLEEKTEQGGEVPPPEKSQEQVEDGPKKKLMPLLVYSSRTGQWEKREFVPGRYAPGHLYDAVVTPSAYGPTVWSSNYWGGSLYMHCHKDILMVLRPSCGTYDMALLPGEPGSPGDMFEPPWKSVLASYEIGIHYVAIDNLQVHVWMLDESTRGQLGWTLAHDLNLNPQFHMIRELTGPLMSKRWRSVRSSSAPVKLTKDNNYDDLYPDDDDDGDEDNDDEDDDDDDNDGYYWNAYETDDAYGCKYSWNSDEDNFVDMGGGTALLGSPTRGVRSRIVGFHPHKNALILVIDNVLVVYHLDTSRVQYLGDFDDLRRDPVQQAHCANASFTYRPCYEDVLSLRKTVEMISLPW